MTGQIDQSAPRSFLATDVDLSYLLDYGGVFEPLRDPAYFSQLRANPEAGTIVWPKEADIAPRPFTRMPSDVPPRRERRKANAIELDQVSMRPGFRRIGANRASLGRAPRWSSALTDAGGQIQIRHLVPDSL